MAENTQDFEDSKWPGLSVKERDRRWSRVREMMRSRGLACLVVFGLKGRGQYDNYLTNDRTGGVVIFPLEDELVHLSWTNFDVSAHLESSLRGEASWVQDFRAGASGAGVVKVLLEKGCERAHVGVVGLAMYAPGEVEGYVPYPTWSHVLENLPHATFHNVSQAFAELVAVKSEEELRMVRRAAEIGELAAQAMIDAARPGAGENEVYAAGMYQLFLNGANGSPSPYITSMILHSGPDNPSWGAPMWLIRGQPPRTLQRGDILQAEIFSRYNGLEAQLQLAVAIGEPDPVNRECAAIARRSYEAGLLAIGPGKRFSDVVEAMAEPLRQAGAWHLTPLIHSMNPQGWVSTSGVGMEKLPGIEAYKNVGARPTIGGDRLVEPGTVWELEPNACLGKRRVNIGGTVIITEEGIVELNVLPTRLRVVDL
ncbi:MAG: aminopeptidase P family protein [Chloroflexi bacterium]|nr:aminopeptidase P family protein [Chloroflexota bacterium]